MPAISVIVPVYQGEAFLEKCVASVRDQRFQDWELILVDDGSPDGSGALCDKLAREDARIRAVHQPNGGVSAARNRGMEEAKGTFLAFADADDWLPPDALEVLHTAAVQAGADSAGGAHWRVEVTGEQVLEPGAMPAGVYTPSEIRTGVVDRLLGQRLGKPGEVLNGFVWRFLFSREIVEKNGLTFLGAYLEDELFLLEYFCLAQKLVMVESPVYCYLQNPVSVTRRYLPGYLDTFTTFMAAKERVAEAYGLGDTQPLWRENSNWSGLLIAIGNEYAKGNPASLGAKRNRVRAFTRRPEMRQAIRSIRPKGLSRNKQLVADLICCRQFTLITLLYAVKNRGQ